MLLNEERGQRELVGVKTGYDVVCCYIKEGTDGSQSVRRRGTIWDVCHKVKMCLFKMNSVVYLSLM